MMKLRVDPLTGNKFIPKRANQKYENRANQIQHNNLVAKEKNTLKSQIESCIIHNESILRKILQDKNEAIVSKDFLLGAGFNFSYHTQSVKIGKSTWICNFGHAYIEVARNKYKIKVLSKENLLKK
jgi:hypothetical protein